MTRSALNALIVVMLPVAPCPAQEWAQKMFATTSHDFGTIGRGSKAEYEFAFTNIYRDDVHVAGVRASCGCTTPRIEKDVVKTYEKSAVVAHINSSTFLGDQGATITVTIDKPSYAEVQLHVKVYVRTDVVLDPPSAVLGNVDQGSEAEQTVKVTYAGRNDWQITEVKSSNPHLAASIVETARGGGQVSYDLRVRLSKDAPAGYIKDHLMLVTNDQRSPQVPVAVEGNVQPEITVSPASLFLGVVKPGEKVTKQVVVHSKKPFKITDVSSECNCLQVAPPSDSSAKALYVLPVTFVASGEAGKVTKSIRIKTDLNGAVGQVSAYAAVTP